MSQPNLDQEPAEGSRDVIDRELARQDTKKPDREPGAKDKPPEPKP
ncbi:hypothetical protein [Neorhizobium lilium]|nr:hypothetical protein [Neorhizobium lilium]